jgi:hypothetical protein
VQRLANEQVHMHALHSGHSGRLFAGASSPFLISLPFLYFLLSLSPLILSPFCFQKPIWGSKRLESSHTMVAMEGNLGSICELLACVKHLYCAHNPQNLSRGRCQNAKTNKIHCSSKTKTFLKDKLSVFKDMFL